MFSTVCQIVNTGPSTDNNLNEILKKFQKVSKVPEELDENNTTDTQKHFQDTIIFSQDTSRYNVRLPWREVKQNLPTNFTVAKKRLNNLLHALQKKDSELINKYNIYPLYIQSDKKEVVKVYICLFTCTALQAIHLEIVEDQTASLFVRAFRQFVCKRGIPEYIISDNAKTFKKRFPRAQYTQKPNTKHNKTPKVSCLPPEKVEVHYRMSSLVGWLL